MSLCNNLTQYGIPYSLTSLHTERRTRSISNANLAMVLRACRVVKDSGGCAWCDRGPTRAFNTVRFSEKILEANGISVEPVDLSEILADPALKIPTSRRREARVDRGYIRPPVSRRSRCSGWPGSAAVIGHMDGRGGMLL